MLPNRRFIIVIGCSLLWAFLVAALFYRVASKGSRRAAAEPGKSLVVATQPLPLGAVVNSEMVKLIEVPEKLFPKGGSSRLEDVLARPVVSPIEADEAVVEARLGAKGSGVGLSPMIPSGLRAMSVRVNDVAGVAGFVLPGMKVDVLVTGRPPGRDDTFTTTVLQNIPVLTAGQTIQADAKGQPISATVVTLLVNPSQAEALTLANNEGHIQLVLRNSTDQQVSQTSGSHLRGLYAAEPLAVIPSIAGPAPPRHRSSSEAVRPGVVPALPVPPLVRHSDEVIMIRGNQKTIEPAPAGLGN